MLGQPTLFPLVKDTRALMSGPASPNVLILQHVRPEPPGTIAEALDDHGVSHRTVQIFRDDPVPDTLDTDGLVVMGDRWASVTLTTARTCRRNSP